MVKKTKRKVPLKSLRDKAWKLISEYVRRKDANWQGFNYCFTCGVRSHWKGLQCGHFYHGRLDYDERNLKPQCVSCNHYKSGNLGEYAARLIKENGQEWLDKLKKDSLKKGNDYKRKELLAIIEKYQKLLSEL